MALPRENQFIGEGKYPFVPMTNVAHPTTGLKPLQRVLQYSFSAPGVLAMTPADRRKGQAGRLSPQDGSERRIEMQRDFFDGGKGEVNQ